MADSSGTDYWFNGLPRQGVASTAGDEKYWFNGLPMSSVVPLSGVPVSAGTVIDTETVFGPTIANTIQVLLPGLIAGDDSIPFASRTGGDMIVEIYRDTDVIFAPAFAGASTQKLQPLRYIDPEVYPGYVVTRGGAPRTLLPPLVSAGETIYAPNVARSVQYLLPSQVDAGDIIFEADEIGPPPPGKQIKLHASKIQGIDADVIYPPRFSNVPLLLVDPEPIYQPVVLSTVGATAAFVVDDDVIPLMTVVQQLPSLPLVIDDDVIYGDVMITMVLEPVLLDSDDDIPFADVGWQVIASFTDDEEVVFDISVQAYNELLPDALIEEDVFETYPFFLQQVEGGIPVKQLGEVLTGSIKASPRLTGSINTSKAA